MSPHVHCLCSLVCTVCLHHLRINPGHVFCVSASFFARIICRAIGFRMRFVEHLRCVACERCFSVICSRTFARGMCVTCCTVVASWYVLLCWLVSACVVCLRISPLHVRITIRITWLCPLLYLLCCLVSCMCVRTSPHHLRIMSASSGGVVLPYVFAVVVRISSASGAHLLKTQLMLRNNNLCNCSGDAESSISQHGCDDSKAVTGFETHLAIQPSTTHWQLSMPHVSRHQASQQQCPFQS